MVATPLAFSTMQLSNSQAASFSGARAHPAFQPFAAIQQQQRSSSARRAVVSAASTASSSAETKGEIKQYEETEEDLWQYPDRDQWYAAKFAAIDQPDWHPARFVRSVQLAPGLKEVTLEVEISRERVPIRNAYKHIGQIASIRINGGVEQRALPTVPPFPMELLRDGLLRVRGDMTANETKTAVEEGSVRAELSVLAREDSNPELYKCIAEDLVECGPFQGAGLELRGAIAAIFRCPTIVIFCEGDGIATARALVTANSDAGGLSFKMRQDARLYYRAPNAASLCYAEDLPIWEKKYGVKVVTATRDSFQDMFDDDDTLAYDPDATAAIILTGSQGGEVEDAAAEVAKEAEIGWVVRQSVERDPTQYL